MRSFSSIEELSGYLATTKLHNPDLKLHNPNFFYAYWVYPDKDAVLFTVKEMRSLGLRT